MTNGSRCLARVALGAAGGLAGTLAIQALMAAGRRWLPSTLPPLRTEPGSFMVERAERALPRAMRGRIPDRAEEAAAGALGLGYGLTFGACYAAVRPGGGDRFVDGPVLGAACWAAGYLGWLPALGLMPPVWKQEAPQVIGPAAEHLAYGVATVATYDWLRRRTGLASHARP
jgi:hypothetical protein